MVSLVDRETAGPGRDELPGSSTRSCSSHDGAVVEFRSLGLLQDGDGTDHRTGWPAVIRGRQYRGGSTQQ